MKRANDNHPPLDLNDRRLRLDPHHDAFVQNPYQFYTEMHAHAPVFFWEDYGRWCCAGYDTVNRLLRDRRFGRERPSFLAPPAGDRSHLADFDAVEARSMLELEPPVHTRLRTLVNRAFVARQVERLGPEIEALAHKLIDGFEGAREIDLLPAFATPIPVAVIASMLGVPQDMAPQLLDWSHRMVAMYMHGRSRETEDSANRAAAEFSAFLRELIEERRGAPGDDLLSVLIKARDHGEKLSDAELVTSVILLLNAGHEATVQQTGNAIRTLLLLDGDPRDWFSSGEAAVATVEEALRIDPPLHMFARYAYEAVEIAPDVTLQPGDSVGLLLGAANHDPAAFDEPDIFRPDRADQKNVTFGAGIHFCIGAPLARLEMQIGLKVLFDRLPGLHFAEEPRYADTFHFHGLERLMARW